MNTDIIEKMKGRIINDVLEDEFSGEITYILHDDYIVCNQIIIMGEDEYSRIQFKEIIYE